MVRRLAALAFVGVAVAIATHLRWVRIAEAKAVAVLVGALGTRPGRLNATVWVRTPDDLAAGINIVTGCSVGLLVIPLALVTGLALLTGRLRIVKALQAFVAAALIATVLNQLRYAVTLYAIHRWGFEDGYGQTHVLVGSLVSTVGIVVATSITAVVVLRHTEGRPHG
jgi:exosortase/archaeosortase family protein